VAAAGLLVLAGAGTAVSLTGDHRVEQRSVLTHDITALNVPPTGDGDVSVRTGAAPGTVEVVRKSRSGSITPPGTWEGSTLTLAPGCPGCDTDYEIRVPNGVDVTAHTGSGDIEVDGALRAVDLQSGSGQVDVNAATTTLAARTGDGDIDLRMGNAPTELTATSGSGDVEIRLPDGQSYVLDVQSGSGDSRVEIPQQPTAEHRVQVRTGSGDISVRGG
jgi:hypothetical protein